MRTRFPFLAALFLSLSIAFVSCQKDSGSTNDNSADATTHSDDQNRFATESDQVAVEVNDVMEANLGMSGRGNGLNVICDATVAVDTVSNPRTITITYNGSNCIGNRTRTGKVIISMLQNIRWKNAGATINVQFVNLKITRTSDGKSITINGSQTYTNVSGGLLVNLPVLNTITHTISSSNMSVTFDNGQQRTWQVARKRVYTYNNGIVLTVTGNHTEGSNTNIAEWGTNRFGGAFTTSITQPLVFRQDCAFRLGSGKVEHVAPTFDVNVTFGLNSTGVPTTCPGTGNYYMKLEWTGPLNVTRTLILPY